MIVDLARNDLGRVCEPGSVAGARAVRARAHPGPRAPRQHGARDVCATDVGLGRRCRATFPPASVTGAPKPRVLQEIEDLEPVRRGVYCGAVGWIDTERGAGDLAVAIRTFTVIERARRTLGVGGGIIADSDPAAEWRETELKAARLRCRSAAPASGARVDAIGATVTA